MYGAAVYFDGFFSRLLPSRNWKEGENRVARWPKLDSGACTRGGAKLSAKTPVYGDAVYFDGFLSRLLPSRNWKEGEKRVARWPKLDSGACTWGGAELSARCRLSGQGTGRTGEKVWKT